VSGRAGVQDEASQLAAIAVARAAMLPASMSPAVLAHAAQTGSAGGETRPDTADDRWLDLCAGPGGKARLLAGLAAGLGPRLIAAEVREHRARLVREVTRASATAGGSGSAGSGVSPAGAVSPQASSCAVLVADGRWPAWRPGRFSRVLADVPCTGLGALRRRPEARWRRRPEDVADLATLQRDLLRTALDSARPGGVVGYVTCSPHVAETREVVAAVLAERPGTEVLDAPAVLGAVPGLRCPDPYGRYAQFWPHRHGTDAMFVALLRRG
jgi:16S rRNA (cytosine967-C5)-methyltransferase